MYNLEYLLAIGFVFLALVLVCVPRPRKGHMMTPEELKKQQVRLKKQKAVAAKKKASKAAHKKKKAKAK